MFYGEYQHTIDLKGRVIVPSKLREGLGEKFIVTKGLDNCLFAYSLTEWANIEAKIKTLPFTDKDVRTFVRFFFSGASECEVDKQGRILIPGNLREYAGLDKDLVITGASTRVEIWDRTKWEDMTKEIDLYPEKFVEKMSQLGI